MHCLALNDNSTKKWNQIAFNELLSTSTLWKLTFLPMCSSMISSIDAAINIPTRFDFLTWEKTKKCFFKTYALNPKPLMLSNMCSNFLGVN